VDDEEYDFIDIEVIEDEPVFHNTLPSKQLYEEESKKREPFKDGTCGMCARMQKNSSASKIGFCKWDGSLKNVHQEKCGEKYVQRKRSSWEPE